MTRDEFEAIGDLHKKYEQMNKQFLMPELPIMVRVDGRAFHTFTKGLARPYDINLSKCMWETAKTLLDQFNAYIAYQQSDEISLILPGGSMSRMFGGNKDKLLSLISSTASVAFYKALLEHLPEKANTLPIFDARAFQYPTLDMYVGNLAWREADATRNSLTMACHAHFKKDQLHKANREKQHELLHSIGINWNDYPSFFKRGIYFVKRDVKEFMSDEIYDKIPERNKPHSRYYTRSAIVDLSIPPISQVVNMVDVVFKKEFPAT